MLKWQLAQRVELWWWKRYLRGRSKADYLQWKRAYWERFLAQLSPPLPTMNGLRVLDAGCGPAGIFIALPNCTVDAVDPLLHRYEQTLTSHFSPADYPYVQFQSMPLEQWRAPAASYDLIFCLNAINHVADMQACIHNLLHSLKPNGYLVLSSDAHNHRLLKHLFRLLPFDVMHPQQCEPAEYVALLPTDKGEVVQTLVLKREFFFSYYVWVFRNY